MRNGGLWLRIRFSKHAVDRYKERMTCIDGTAVENWCQNVERLARDFLKAVDLLEVTTGLFTSSKGIRGLRHEVPHLIPSARRLTKDF